MPEREEEKIEDQDPFSKYLQPMTPRMSMAPKGYSVLDAIPDDDSFTTKTEANYVLTFSPDLKSMLCLSVKFNKLWNNTVVVHKNWFSASS